MNFYNKNVSIFYFYIKWVHEVVGEAEKRRLGSSSRGASLEVQSFPGTVLIRQNTDFIVSWNLSSNLYSITSSVCHWKNYLASLSFSCPVYKMIIIVVSFTRVVVRIK